VLAWEGAVQLQIIDAVQSNKEPWESTAIFITVDEGGGYYDSGYIENFDFFGDGTRIPLNVISPKAVEVIFPTIIATRTLYSDSSNTIGICHRHPSQPRQLSPPQGSTRR
jgi:hypothetical protein